MPAAEPNAGGGVPAAPKLNGLSAAIWLLVLAGCELPKLKAGMLAPTAPKLKAGMLLALAVAADHGAIGLKAGRLVLALAAGCDAPKLKVDMLLLVPAAGCEAVKLKGRAEGAWGLPKLGA